ncbi:MAG: hypothetical protein JOZ13_04505 [Alphaproteobacteria bacterium]|nr:hypothetical protein [Alphaproteobacteria bacterium]
MGWSGWARPHGEPHREAMSDDEKAEDAGAALVEDERRMAREKRPSGRRSPVEGATRAELKAAKKLARVDRRTDRKRQKQSTKPKQQGVSPEPVKAERKAAKKQARVERRTDRKRQKQDREPKAEDAPAKPANAERKAAKKQARVERRAARKDQSAKNSKPSLGEIADGKEAQTAARKADRKAKKADADPAARAEQRKARREAKKADADPAARAEQRKARREAKKASGDEDDGPRPYRFKIFAPHAEPLRSALLEGFAAAAVKAEERDEGRVDLAVHDFDAAPDPERYGAAMAQATARTHVLIERQAVAQSGALVKLAAMTGAAILQIEPGLQRFGAGSESANEGLIAEWVLAIASARSKKVKFAPPRRAPADLAAVRDSFDRPAEFLGLIRNVVPLPKALSARPSEEDAAGLAESKIVLGSEISIALERPLNWSREFPDRRSSSAYFGLDYLTGVFSYWYARVQGQSSQQVKAIDAALKSRDATPNTLLARAMQIVDDFVTAHPREDGGPAWQDQAVLRRVRVLLLYVLCCRAALKRKIGFNEATFAATARALLDHIEILRSDARYAPVSRDGIEQDCLLIGIALALRGPPYAGALLDDSLARLKRLQLDPGLTQEGVWLGDSFGEHCAILAEISGLCGDFPPTHVARAEPLAAAAKKMTAFAEAMLKCNGEPPAIDASRQRSYAERLMGARKTLAKAAGKSAPQGKQPLRMRITDTYVFREAQYFISHSSTSVSPDSSLVVLHADPPSLARGGPGGITLVFAHGAANLLVRAAPPEDEEDESSAHDPALRNGVRIDGQGYRAVESGSAVQVRIAKSWRGQGWAAARCLESNHDGGSLARTAIHIKAAHALVVVDELESADGAEHDFTQFWNIAPEFSARQEGPASALHSDALGTLNIACSGEAALASRAGDGGAQLSRSARLAKGALATLFQWTEQPAPLAIAIEPHAADWSIRASGQGFEARLAFCGGELRCELAQTS